MFFMRYSAVIFDFDYTLADATEGIVESYNYALKRAGLPSMPVERIRKTIGMTVEDALKELCSCSDETIAAMQGDFRRRADEIMLESTVLYPFTRPLLEELARRGVKTGIVTTKIRRRIEEVFLREGLLDRLGVVVGVADTSRPKPDPEGLLKALSSLGVRTDEALYVGDHFIDAQTAQAANVDFAAVLTGTTTREDFRAFPCRFVLEDAGGLLKIKDIF